MEWIAELSPVKPHKGVEKHVKDIHLYWSAVSLSWIEWSIVSKAADKSRRTNPTATPLSIEVAMSFYNFRNDVSVERKTLYAD